MKVSNLFSSHFQRSPHTHTSSSLFDGLPITGIVVREKKTPEDMEGRYLAGEEKFTSAYLWGHDFTLDFSSPHLKALEWVTLADEVCLHHLPFFLGQPDPFVVLLVWLFVLCCIQLHAVKQV